MGDLRFDGWIAGLGTTSGFRLVVGCWPGSPYGPVADVMVETAEGHRLLLAPTQELADFVSATYRFDEIRIVAVTVEPMQRDEPGQVHVCAGDLSVRLVVGSPTWLGRLLRLVPAALAGRLWWVALLDRPGAAARARGAHGRHRWWRAQGVVRGQGQPPAQPGRRLVGRQFAGRSRRGRPAGALRFRVDPETSVLDAAHDDGAPDRRRVSAATTAATAVQPAAPAKMTCSSCSSARWAAWS